MEFALPAGPWRVLALAIDGGGEARPCGFGQVVIRSGVDEQLTLILALDAEGRCPPGAPPVDEAGEAEQADELVADFTFDFDREVTSPTSCPVVATRLLDTSQGEPVAWRWEFANGEISTDQNPVLPGDGREGEVTLRVEDALGRSDEVTKSVQNDIEC